jgi:hypothetical protein
MHLARSLGTARVVECSVDPFLRALLAGLVLIAFGVAGGLIARRLTRGMTSQQKRIGTMLTIVLVVPIAIGVLKSANLI